MTTASGSPTEVETRAKRLERERRRLDQLESRCGELAERLAPNGTPRDFHAKLVLEGCDQKLARMREILRELEREPA
jgi:hypothetical protein